MHMESKENTQKQLISRPKSYCKHLTQTNLCYKIDNINIEIIVLFKESKLLAYV